MELLTNKSTKRPGSQTYKPLIQEKLPRIDNNSGSSDEEGGPVLDKSQLFARLDEMKRAIDGYKEKKASKISTINLGKSPKTVAPPKIEHNNN